MTLTERFPSSNHIRPLGGNLKITKKSNVSGDADAADATDASRNVNEILRLLVISFRQEGPSHVTQ